MRGMLLLLVPVFIISCAPSGMDVEEIQDEIMTLIKRQEAAWNARDIQGFMADYWKSGEMTFQSGNNRLRGWESLVNRYQTIYAGELMGKLFFSDLEVHVLGSDHAYAIGRYNVEQPEGVKTGLFTIILKKTDSVWKIIHDHSS